MPWLVWTNLLMAASAAGWTIITLRILNLPFDWTLILLAFCLTVIFYLRDRLDIKELRADQVALPERTAWIWHHKPQLYSLMGMCGLGVIIILVMRPQVIWPLLMGVGFALTYTVRWFPWRGMRLGWKHFPGFKMPFVATLWVLTTVLTPAFVYQQWHTFITWRLVGAICCLIMGQILLNDLRDQNLDVLNNTLSLPVIIGDQSARWAGILLMAVSVGLMWQTALMPFLITAAYTGLLLWRYRPPRHAHWQVWIESQGIIAALAVWVAFY